ncbi:MAG: hypothetical protein ABFR53_03690 [Actinomycetota bacterium]
MAILHSFKQTVLELGRTEAKAKARPLTVGGESLDRSAAGMDARSGERAVMFWVLSDRALFLVVGSDPGDFAYRVPYESVGGFHLDYDEAAEFLPWYVRVAIDPDAAGSVTRLEHGNPPGQPLAPPPPVEVEGDELARLVRGETIPLTGFGAFPKRFRDALTRRMELAGRPPSITGAEAADRPVLASMRKGSRQPSADSQQQEEED